MGTIILEGMEFFAYHGCFKEEQLIGTKFTVDLTIITSTIAAEISDHLHDTVDYSALYTTVQLEMSRKSSLLEHVAWRIVESLKRSFPQLESVALKINKINPPIGGKINQVSFLTTWSKV